MTEIACLIADMIRAGVDPDLVGRTAEAFAAGPQRTARQERNARYYAKRPPPSVSMRLNKTLQTLQTSTFRRHRFPGRFFPRAAVSASFPLAF